MKVKDLKEILDNLPEEDLELDVHVVVDHGQDVPSVRTAGDELVEMEEFNPIHEDGLPEYDA